MAAAIVIGVHLFVTKKKIKITPYKNEDFLLCVFLISFCISVLIHPNSASLNYISAYLYVFLIAYLLLKGVFYNYLSADEIKKWLMYGVLITALVSISEFVLEFSTSIDFNTILFRIKEEYSNYAGILPRSLAFSHEPGILAFYLETIGVLAIWFISQENWKASWKALSIVIIIAGWIFTFSAASFVALFISAVIVLSIIFFQAKRIKDFIFISVLIFALLVIVLVAMNIATDTFMGDIIAKATLSEANVSARYRIVKWQESIQSIIENPIFGIGPGSAAAKGNVGSLSWYIFLTKEAGLVAVIPMILFLLIKFSRIVSSTVKGKNWFLFAFLNGAIHLAVISTFFHPFLWALLVVFEVISAQYIFKRSNTIING